MRFPTTADAVADCGFRSAAISMHDFHILICFSRVIAVGMSSNSSNRTSRCTPYFCVEAADHVLATQKESLGQSARHADVECAIPATRKQIHTRTFHCIAKPLDSRLRGNEDRKSVV